MKKSRFTDSQVITVFQAGRGLHTRVLGLSRKQNDIRSANFYRS